eukprot:TCONS_00001508-protein
MSTQFSFTSFLQVLLLLKIQGPQTSDAYRTARCIEEVCSSTLKCDVAFSYKPSLKGHRYCIGDDKYIQCRDCRLEEETISVSVHISGIQDHTKLQGYSRTLLQFVNQWCPKIGCNVLYFKNVPKLSRFNFFTYPGVWDMATTTLIADNIHTKLYFIKYIGGRPIGAVDPIDIARLLSTEILRKTLLQRYGVTIKTDIIDINYKRIIDAEINKDLTIIDDKNLETGEDDEKTNEKDNSFSSESSLKARIMILILFGVLLVTVFISIVLFRAKPRCLRHFHTLQRTSSTQDVIQDTANNDLDNQPSSSTNQNGVDGFLEPPPYSEDDRYRKDNPPPKYDELFMEENRHTTTAEL